MASEEDRPPVAPRDLSRQEQRRALRIARDEQKEVLRRAVCDADWQSASDSATRIKGLDSVQQVLENGRRAELFWQIGFAIVSALIVVLLAKAVAPDTRLNLAMKSSSVTFSPSPDAIVPINASLPATIAMSGLCGVTGDVIATTGNTPCFLAMSARSISIAEWVPQAGGYCEIETTSPGNVVMTIYGPGRCTLAAAGKITARLEVANVRRDTTFIAEAPQELSTCLAQTSQPMQLRFSAPIDFSHVPVNSLSFMQTVSGDAVPLSQIVTIREGTLSIPRTQQSIKIGDRELITLDGVAGEIQLVTDSSDLIDVTFEGTVKRMVAGEDRRPLLPSRLEVIYHEYKNSIVLAAGLALWGILWSTRKRIAGH